MITQKNEYIICPKCKQGGAEYIGKGWYQCLWSDCSNSCVPTRFKTPGKIDPNKFKKFRDSIKIKKGLYAN